MGNFVLAVAALVMISGEPSVGEQHRLIARPGAELRDGAGRAEMRLTVWYPAALGGTATSIDLGPPEDPQFELGSFAVDAPFRKAGRRTGLDDRPVKMWRCRFRRMDYAVW